MDWFLWTIVGLWILSSLTTIAIVGKPRKPVTPGFAVYVVIFNAAAIVGLLLTR